MVRGGVPAPGEPDTRRLPSALGLDPFAPLVQGRQPNPDGFLSDVMGVCNPLMAGATPAGTYMALMKAEDLLKF